MRILPNEPRSEREDKQAQKAARRAKIVKVFVLHFASVVGKKPDPQVEPHG